MPLVTPTRMTLPTSSTALALLLAAMRSPPVVFWKPKVPVTVTKLAICALSPVTTTAVTPLVTLIGAETATPPTLMAMVVLTFAPVWL